MPNDYDLFLGLGCFVIGILMIIIGLHREWW